MRNRISACLAFICSLSFSTAARGEAPAALAAQKAPIVAVFDVQATGVKLGDEERDRLSEMLVSSLSTGGAYRIVPRSELRSRLRSQKLETYKACFDKSCQIAVGRELAAQKSLVSKILGIGSTCTFTAVLYDLKTGTSEGGGHQTGKCTVEGIMSSMQAVVRELIKIHPPAAAPKPAPAATPPPQPPAPKTRVPPSQLSNERLRFTTDDESRTFGVTVVSGMGEVHSCQLSLTSPCALPRVGLGKARVSIRSEGLHSFGKAITLDGQGAQDKWKTVKVHSRPSALSIVGWSLGGVALAAGIAVGVIGAARDSGPMITGGAITGVVGAGVIVGSFFLRSTVDAQTGFLNLGWDLLSLPEQRRRRWAVLPTVGGAVVHAAW